jgi:hypothetical protein
MVVECLVVVNLLRTAKAEIRGYTSLQLCDAVEEPSSKLSNIENDIKMN